MKNTILEKAGQMAIMDAIEKGHTDKDQLIEYMASKTFKKSVLNYIDMMTKEFK